MPSKRSRFSSRTWVSPERTKQEVTTALSNGGATSITIAEEFQKGRPSRIVVGFFLRKNRYIIPLDLPELDGSDATEQERCRRWRVMLLFCKAIMEASQLGMMGDAPLTPFLEVPDHLILGPSEAAISRELNRW